MCFFEFQGLVTYDDSDASRSDGESDADNDARNASDVDSEFELKVCFQIFKQSTNYLLNRLLSFQIEIDSSKKVGIRNQVNGDRTVFGRDGGERKAMA